MSGSFLDSVALSRIERSATAALERVGYRLLAVEIDIEAGRARVEVRRRHDGYTLTLDVRNGVGSITREMMQFDVVAVGRRGDRFMAERCSMRFLGRTRLVGGARSALRSFAGMIGDNAAVVEARLDARRAIAMLIPGDGA